MSRQARSPARSDGWTIAATLRHNVALATDVELARRELAALSGALVIREIEGPGALATTPIGRLPAAVRARIEATVRSRGPVGFVVEAGPEAFHRLATRSAFLQDLAASPSRPGGRFDRAPPHPLIAEHASDLLSATPLVTLAELASSLAGAPTSDGHDRLDSLLATLQRGEEGPFADAIARAIRGKKSTLCLSHDLHIYKAKFFPRMAHALLNIFAGDGGGGDARGTIFDPFSGSGTALLEASLLGRPSFGVDVDPLSALISDCKVRPFTRDRAASRALLRRAITELDAPPRKKKTSAATLLSDELRGKLARYDARRGTAYLPEIEEDLERCASLLQRCRGERPGLLEVLLSDAVTKKIRYRFVGVGNGRYTIELTSQRIRDRLRDKLGGALALCDVFAWMEARCGAQFGESAAAQGSAVTLAGAPESLSIGACLTSPPYLPASSGREHYAPARALALAVTGMEGRLDAAHFVGAPATEVEAEVEVRRGFDPSTLTPAGRALVGYLLSDSGRTDPQRDPMRFERKAIPTWRYLRDIEAFLGALRPRMAAGGACVMVVASQHTFYSHRRREEAKRSGEGGAADSIEYVASGREIYGELAERAGFALDEEVRMELAKSAISKARPRASDAYHESALVLRAG